MSKMILIATSLITCLGTCAGLYKAMLADDRGTNTVTRFVRDAATYTRYKWGLRIGLVELGVFAIWGLTKGTVVPAIFPLCVIGFSAFLMHRNTYDKQRVMDSRSVVKDTLQTTGQVAEGAAQVAGYAAAMYTTKGNSAAAEAASNASKQIGKAAGGVVTQMADRMDDVESTPIQIDPVDADMIIAAADRMGISTEGKSIEQISDKIVKFAPTAAIAALPEDLSNVEKAKRIVANDV